MTATRTWTCRRRGPRRGPHGATPRAPRRGASAACCAQRPRTRRAAPRAARRASQPPSCGAARIARGSRARSAALTLRPGALAAPRLRRRAAAPRQIQHLLQTAEACRAAYPEEDWLHLTAFIHGALRNFSMRNLSFCADAAEHAAADAATRRARARPWQGAGAPRVRLRAAVGGRRRARAAAAAPPVRTHPPNCRTTIYTAPAARPRRPLTAPCPCPRRHLPRRLRLRPRHRLPRLLRR
jgi:hypothetical protein